PVEGAGQGDEVGGRRCGDLPGFLGRREHGGPYKCGAVDAPPHDRNDSAHGWTTPCLVLPRVASGVAHAEVWRSHSPLSRKYQPNPVILSVRNGANFKNVAARLVLIRRLEGRLGGLGPVVNGQRGVA